MGSEEHPGNYNNLLMHTLDHQPFLMLVGIIPFSTIIPLSRELSIFFLIFQNFPIISSAFVNKVHKLGDRGQLSLEVSWQEAVGLRVPVSV